MMQNLPPSLRAKGPKELHLSHVSQTTYAITLKNVDGHLLSNILATVKQYGGRYSKVVNKYEFQIKKCRELMKEIKYLDRDIVIRDVPADLLKELLFSYKNSAENKPLKTFPKKMWNRVLVGDPLLVRRYNYINNVFSAKSKGDQPQKPKRILLICWEVVLNSWITNFLELNNFSFEIAHYESITSEKFNLPKKVTHFEVLTYEKVLEFGNWLTKQHLAKYSSLLCDDCQIWLEPEESRFKDPEGVGRVIKRILTEKYPPEKDLMILSSQYLIHKVELALEVGSILLPKKFGPDSSIQANRLRYIKDRKSWHELCYIFNSNCFINLLLEDPFEVKKEITLKQLETDVLLDNTVPIIFGDAQIKKLKQLDAKFKNLDKEKAIANFQKDRFAAAHLFMNATKFEELKYIKQLRQILTEGKIPFVNRFLYHMAKDLRQKTVVVVEDQYFQKKLEQFLKENSISFVVYDIDYNELCESKQRIYVKFNLRRQVSVCILVRDKLLKQYKDCIKLREKQLQNQYERQAEEQLAIQRGGLRGAAQYRKTPLDQSYNDKNKEDLFLKKINTVRHILFLDTFWYDFSADKQDIIYNIFDSRLPAFHKIESNQSGALGKQQGIHYKKRVQKVKHYFTVKGSYQNEVYEKYWINLESHEDEREKPKRLLFQQMYQQKIKELLFRYSFPDKPRIEGIVDIDQDFDKLQFEVLKQKQQQKKEAELKQKPMYNTNPPGLVIETPHLYQLQSFEGEDQEWESQQVQYQKKKQLRQKNPKVEQVEGLEVIPFIKAKSKTVNSQQNIEKYLIPDNTEQKVLQHYKQQILPQIRKKQFQERLIIDLNTQLPFTAKNSKQPTTQQIKSKIYKNTQQIRSHPVDDNPFQREKPMISPKTNLIKEQNAGRPLWKSREKSEKIICRKLKTLKVVLIPGKSSLGRSRSASKNVEQREREQ